MRDHSDPEQQPPVASLRGVRVSYGNEVALDHVDVELPAGLCGLLGPNGAGKSTLFRVLLGLTTPESGEVDVLGWPSPAAARQIRREIGFMPEDDSLFPELKAVDQVVHAARLSGLSRVDATVAAHRTLDRVELGGHRYRKGAMLSLGGRQRLRLAMAMVHAPRLLILDEPTAGLDPEARAEMLDLVGEVAASGTSVLLSTHVLGDVEAICQSVVVLSRGKVAFSGDVARFRALPQHGASILVELDRDAAPLLPALQQAGLTVSADGARLHVHGEPTLSPAFWEVVGRAGVGICSVQPAREAMAEAFVRHLRLDDPSRRVAEGR